MNTKSHGRLEEEEETDKMLGTPWVRRTDDRGHKYWENEDTGERLFKTYRLVGPDGGAVHPHHHPQHIPQHIPQQQPPFVHPHPYAWYPPVAVYPPHHQHYPPAGWVPAFVPPAPGLPPAHAFQPPPPPPPSPAGRGGEGAAKGKKEKGKKQPVVWVEGHDEKGVKCWKKEGTDKPVYEDPYY